MAAIPEEPSDEEIEHLLKSTHSGEVPHWTSTDIFAAREQLTRLYYHWFRRQPP